MAPSGALIFKLEQTFFRATLDYAGVRALLREKLSETPRLPDPWVAPTMLTLKKKLGKKAYASLRSNAESLAEKMEAGALAGAQMHPGVEKMLEYIRDTGWWIVGASDIGKKQIADFLDSKAIGKYLNLVVARSRLDEERKLATRLRPVKTRLKTLANSVYFCNSSKEVAEAKELGMRCFVLPSPVEPFRTLYQAGPNGIILSLDEIPPLLSLPTMKLPEPSRPNPKLRASREDKRATTLG